MLFAGVARKLAPAIRLARRALPTLGGGVEAPECGLRLPPLHIRTSQL